MRCQSRSEGGYLRGRPLAQCAAGPSAAPGPTAGYQTRPVVGPLSQDGVSDQRGAMFDAKQWRERAEQSRIHAEQTSDPAAREILLEIARAYENLARNAEVIPVGKKGSPMSALTA